MRKKIYNIFLTGIIVIIPVGVTIYILYLLVQILKKLVGLIPPYMHPETYLPFPVPGLGFVLAVIIIFFVGLVTKSYVGKKVVGLGEKIVDQIPLVRSIYNAAKQLAEALIGDKSRSFKKVVLIEYPRRGLYCLAFVTDEVRGELRRRTGDGFINVFVPTTPNPTSGFYIVLPESDVIHLEMNVEEAFTLLISGGIISPPEKIKNNSARQSIAEEGDQ